MCLKTDTILLEYMLRLFQYFITTCLCMVQCSPFDACDHMHTCQHMHHWFDACKK